ncbi:N-6 DNA methylase [bacterium]|nr:N-6 DNA methylase [bacterium]
MTSNNFIVLTMFDSYLQSLFEITKRGDAREESYYSTLEDLIHSLAKHFDKAKVQVTTLPKKTEAGNPDFRVWDGALSQIGYIEAKTPQTDLREIEESEQLERYLDTFPNVILTNFYEFRLYRKGQKIETVLLARPMIASKLKSVPPAERPDELLKLFERFFEFSLPTTFTAESLARELAIRTRFLRDQVIKEELREATTGHNRILGFYEAFSKHLIAHLKPDEFADLYAQTVTYGLFAARTRSDNGFNRKVAYDLIPKTIGILRDIFHFISYDPPRQLEVIVDDIAEILAAADVRKILHDYSGKGKGSDPIFHFYETFLAEYNPVERERRGVYYTPEPVVSYIVRSVHKILKDEFGHADGLASSAVTVLDPAGGTLTFLAEAAKLAVEEFTGKFGDAAKGRFIEDHVLKHFYAFELMMAPYAAGHLKMGYLLEELGHKLKGDERFQFYLTNTLEMEELAQTSLPGMASLSEESHLAGKVKKDQPILVIIGNPPYSGISANASEKIVRVEKGDNYILNYDIKTVVENGRTFYRLLPKFKKATKNIQIKQKTWIGELIEHFKIIDGDWFGERKHWLQDDYVKFIRFAQWKIDQCGQGVVGLITNHSYLDNPTFRGMRQSLMNSFDEIYVLDLHGNSLKKEKSPDGSKDVNVFDIQQGVAILIMIKKDHRKSENKIYHYELWGERDDKYNFLAKKDRDKTEWNLLKPNSPFYFFVPKEEKHRNRYDRYLPVSEIFPVNVTGIVTARDGFVIDMDERTLEHRIKQFRDLDIHDKIIETTYGLKDTRGWKMSKARKILAKDEEWKQHFTTILYRPFDLRNIYYTPTMVDWGRFELMKHMMQYNLALITPKQFKEESGAYVSRAIIGHKTVSAYDINYLFPLYLYDDPKEIGGVSGGTRGTKYQMSMVLEPEPKYKTKGKTTNISDAVWDAVTDVHGKFATPENIFYYIYAVLYSPKYRKKYAEFLKTDFPRVPFTADKNTFKELAEFGEALTNLHLLKLKKLNSPIAKCEGKGDFKVEKIRYEAKEKRVYINADQYFSGVAPEVWEYHIGGYQVPEKWLKDRKGRALSSDDIRHYCLVITVLEKTIDIQSELDPLFDAVEKDILQIQW